MLQQLTAIALRTLALYLGIPSAQNLLNLIIFNHVYAFDLSTALSYAIPLSWVVLALLLFTHADRIVEKYVSHQDDLVIKMKPIQNDLQRLAFTCVGILLLLRVIPKLHIVISNWHINAANNYSLPPEHSLNFELVTQTFILIFGSLLLIFMPHRIARFIDRLRITAQAKNTSIDPT